MTPQRDAFLQTIRAAVREGNRAGIVPPQPERGGVGYQGGGDDVMARFAHELHAAGGECHLGSNSDEGLALIYQLVSKHGGRRIAIDRSPLLRSLGVAKVLSADGRQVWQEPLELDDEGEVLAREKRRLFEADIGITGVDYLIAETGSIILFAKPGALRSVSLLPPVHIAVAERKQVLPDLFDLFAELDENNLPACVSIITGPSKTGDIELQLVTGVHGPGDVRVILIDSGE